MSDHHHHHHHGHHDEHDDLNDDMMMKDPGNQAIAEALRLCFILLQIVIVCAVLLFIWSGFFTVAPNERAIVLRFGNIRGGEDVSSVIRPGRLNWAWPYPIDEVIKIPAENAELELVVNEFWYDESDQEAMGMRRRRPNQELQFTRDGYSVTASKSAVGEDYYAEQGGIITDYSIAHSKWKIRYKITDPLLFFKTVWAGNKTEDKEYDWSEVESLLKSILRDAVVVISARNDIWSVWENPMQFRQDVELYFQQRLEELDVGIAAREARLDLINGNIAPPVQVEEAFNRAASAGITAREYVKGAQAQADETLSAAQADAIVTLAHANNYKTRVVQAAQADARYLDEVLRRIDEAVALRVPDSEADFQAKRRDVRQQLLNVTVDQLYQEMLRGVVSDADEVFVLNAKEGDDVEWRPILSRDATIKTKGKQDKEEEGKRLYEHQPAQVSSPDMPN